MMELSYDPPLREILRYLGCREESAGRALLEEVDECVRQLGIVVTPRHIYRKYEISQNENGMLRIGGIQIRSRDLSKNLAGCSSCYMIAATLGLGPDRLIKRSQTGRISEAVIYQAAAAAMIASMALPPFFRISRPAAAAWGVEQFTMPFFAKSG